MDKQTEACNLRLQRFECCLCIEWCSCAQCFLCLFVNAAVSIVCFARGQVIKEAPLFGFEQEYTMLQKGSGMVLGWPEGGYPAPQVCAETLSIATDG